MRKAVQAQPTITVRELAALMGYSEERSVYYWLQRAGFKGLRDFKASVLTGWDHGDDASVKMSGIVAGVQEDGDDEYKDRMLTVDTAEFAPWLLPGDRLVLDATQKPRDGHLVVLRFAQGKTLLRRYIEGNPPLFIHPANPKQLLRPLPHHEPYELTCVTRLIRELP